MISLQSRVGAVRATAVVRSRSSQRLSRRRSNVIVRASSFSEEDHTSEEEHLFFYEETSTNDRLKDWRTFRAMMVASERDGGVDGIPRVAGMDIGGGVQGGEGSPASDGRSRRDELRRLFRMSHVRESLEKHLRARANGSNGLNGGDGDGVEPRRVPNRGKNTSVWSHTITHPERGCLLVAKRPDLGMFSYSVVLLTEHDDEIGSSGLVLNMATPLHVSNLGLEDHISASLGKLPLYIGGPVTRNLLHVLHGVGAVEGSMEIVPGVYAGGVESAADLVLRGELEAGEFRLLAGYSGWEPYQLSEEIMHGAWHVISASSDVILGCIKGDFSGFSGGLDVSGQHESGTAGLYGFAGQDVGVDTTKLNCWKAILSETMFGES